jgi:hypothetical protein
VFRGTPGPIGAVLAEVATTRAGRGAGWAGRKPHGVLGLQEVGDSLTPMVIARLIRRHGQRKENAWEDGGRRKLLSSDS